MPVLLARQLETKKNFFVYFDHYGERYHHAGIELPWTLQGPC